MTTSNPYASEIASASSQYGVPSSILSAQLAQESGFNPNAVSSAGAQGIAQFMPATAQSIGLKNPFSASQSISSAAKYDAQNYAQFGSWTKALEAYNQGPTATAQGHTYPGVASYASNILSAAGYGSTSSGSGVSSSGYSSKTNSLNVNVGATTSKSGSGSGGSNMAVSGSGHSASSGNTSGGVGGYPGMCPANDTPMLSVAGYPILTPCGLWDLGVGLVALILIIAGFKSSAPQAMLAIAKTLT
jgi:hypothetical protein